jgi:hypothetical protein
MRRIAGVSMDFDSQLMVCNGYPLFQEMDGTKEKKAIKWKENANRSNYGSMLDCMRCLYHDRWLEAGYHIVTYVKQPNKEKQRGKKIMEEVTRSNPGSLSINVNGSVRAVKSIGPMARERLGYSFSLRNRLSVTCKRIVVRHFTRNVNIFIKNRNTTNYHFSFNQRMIVGGYLF